MKTIKYIGSADVRELSGADIAQAYGIQTKDIRVDKRESAVVAVSNRLADKLLETMPNEWEFVGMGELEDDEEPYPPVVAVVLPDDDSDAAVARAQNQPVPPPEETAAKPAATPKKKG